MLLAGLLLGSALAVLATDTTNDTLSKEPNKADPHEASTLEEALQRRGRRCVPTAVARGPCHACVCSERGAFHCRAEDCHFDERDDQSQPSQPECEPSMLYNEGILWCTCDQLGFWKSANCRANFRYVRNKRDVRQTSLVPLNFTCENGSVYVLECNVCECRGGSLSPAACTNRTCARAHKADQCKPGQLLRNDNQLCACSEIGYYVDKRCIVLPTNATIQKLATQDIASLTADEGAVRSRTEGKCSPDSVIQRDCNRCTCTRDGQLVCTSKLCISQDMSPENISMVVEKALRRPNKHWLLPELKSDKEPCSPGKQYRYQCNTCYCTNKGVPACTTMICLDFFVPPNKVSTRGRERKIHQNLYHLPKINDGDNCTEGRTYRLDCNVCRCNKNRLVCTKKLCLNPREMAKQLEFENKMKHKMKKVIPSSNKDIYMEMFDDKVVIHQRLDHKNGKKMAREGIVVKPVKEQKKNVTDPNFVKKPNVKDVKKEKEIKLKNDKQNASSKHTNDNIQEKEKNKGSNAYPELSSTKCKPGQIYMKGCQRCFCTYKKIAHCTNKPCSELEGPVQVPKDVYPRITPKEINNLPTLPHEAARCKPGKVYTVDCNVCLCLANGNLLCNTQLCLAVDEVNKMAAVKQTGKPCKKSSEDPSKTVPEVEADCIVCSCVQAKFKCTAVEVCTPYRFRRALHGDMDPRVKPKLSFDASDGKCMPGMVYKQNCNNCYCQEDGSLRCTRKGCLNYQQVQKLKKQRQRLLKLGL